MLIPHLHFCGDCREAIAVYENAFCTNAENIVHNCDYAPDECEGDGGIAHAEMRIHGQKVFLNDRFGNRDRTANCAVHLIITFPSREELLAAYAFLSDGSTTIDPLEQLPYSELSVCFIDRFGVQWGFMVDG